MNFSVSSFLAGFIFGMIGFYLFKHGRKEAHVPSMIIGLLMMIYPYFITNAYLTWGIGIGLSFIAYKLIRS